jgi:hypothetical protein
MNGAAHEPNWAKTPKTPVPDEVAARVPQTRDYRYAVAKDRVLLVGTSRIVVGGFADVPVSEERRER